jgi:hypothetical protein
MYLSDIFDQLAYGELRQVFIDTSSLEGSEGIPKEKKRNLFHSIKLGLTELHKRFLLLEKELVVSVIPGKQTYVMDMRYADSNQKSNDAIRYINDQTEPFKNDLMKIERVLDSSGYEFAINQINNPKAVRVTSYNCLTIPDDYTESTFKVVYRADHPDIPWFMAENAAGTVTVNLPSTHLEALLLYVASRVTNPTGMIADTVHEGNNYYSKFLASCDQLKQGGYELDRMEDNTRLRSNGWV